MERTPTAHRPHTDRTPPIRAHRTPPYYKAGWGTGHIVAGLLLSVCGVRPVRGVWYAESSGRCAARSQRGAQ
jgi:hypothetical protein